MDTAAITKMSSKRQDVPPSINEFEKIVMQAREAVIKSGLKPEDISEAIKAERLENANCS